MDDELHQVRISASHATATLALDGRDISKQVRGYQLSQAAGAPPVLVLQMSQLVKDDFEGLARVVIGDPPDPGPAAAAFLAAIDAGELERQVLARHDLMDGGPNELTRAMLRLLQEWARGEWKREVADGVPQ
ncbi:hypothetical protein GCM10014715_39470 [Streptomyces spiralis]|uniref:Uncharacterized protein n=1 Tax=Streptomyces spiralis TaxID=66376 RepID=A0A919A0A1_9ACTN|nr:hypothetical protein [Streptomyces spiralis]GHE80196.1 hypothetical protein GCM10014715_39470 [Streptomyces spiralis]